MYRVVKMTPNKERNKNVNTDDKEVNALNVMEQVYASIIDEEACV